MKLYVVHDRYKPEKIEEHLNDPIYPDGINTQEIRGYKVSVSPTDETGTVGDTKVLEIPFMHWLIKLLIMFRAKFTSINAVITQKGIKNEILDYDFCDLSDNITDKKY